ncbi:MAG TPA: MotA/TolQ/ExbB proton channel family protein [Spirochaetota bacterium]|nr:MotA/TolQ/ExbB proton channel family protein [Spirochaetota bacterium]
MNKAGSDSSVLLGLGVGFGGLLVGFLLEGGKPAGLIGFSALIIILAGTSGALIVSFGMKQFMTIPRLFKDSLKAALGPSKELVQLLYNFAEKARREGLLSLEDDIDKLGDEFLKKGIRLVVDGVDPEIVRNTLENDIALYEHRKKEEVEILFQAGGFSPTMGIVGTVMGLVLVLANLGGDAAALGHSIAAAFIATLYGIGFANLIWLPVANKLKGKMKEEVLARELILTGILSIQAGENPSLIKDKLGAYVEEEIFIEEKK